MPSPRPSHRSNSPSTQDRERRHHRSHHERSHSHRHRHRDRSRSPHRSERHSSGRDRPHRRHDRDREHHDRKSKKDAKPVVLPLQARELTRRDLEVFTPMFAMYLDIQKGIFIEDLSEDEIKGRWKSFIHKWNRAELAEGWYDPATLEKARQSVAERPPPPQRERNSPDYSRGGQNIENAQTVPVAEDDDDEDDDEYGPSIPHHNASRQMARSGPTIPRMQDLELKRETEMEDAIAARKESDLRYQDEKRARKAEMKSYEEEVAPRAEAGTRERQLEKRREAAASNRAFAEARGASPEAAPEADLMGSGDNDLAALKREKDQQQRKKNEREIRREEILRARAAEREERAQKYREKEQETMGWLHTLAKQRFG
ncbi:uncharacterized protein N7483_001370 [Penicillium malachiteum]|uniref:uncharacterized protein n=1 Tax=Penicillium malachiteum TaxID=1324776 RepID=UPI0025474AD5|nr:uncharacterized protein N7483_001370 [Penicillium malachiteum]KAJ5736245.1 hypothetical protein N7483_001370 [Penicillium malachiteum]